MYSAKKELTITLSSDTAVVREIPKPKSKDINMPLAKVARIQPIGCNVVIKFGNATVAADRTEDAKGAKADDNFTVQDGAIEPFLVPAGSTHVSAQVETAATTGKVLITFGSDQLG